jgi:hypothetical protein
MARKPRIHHPGGVYHVIFSGNGGQPVFLRGFFGCGFYKSRYFIGSIISINGKN